MPRRYPPRLARHNAAVAVSQRGVAANPSTQRRLAPTTGREERWRLGLPCARWDLQPAARAEPRRTARSTSRGCGPPSPDRRRRRWGSRRSTGVSPDRSLVDQTAEIGRALGAVDWRFVPLRAGDARPGEDVDRQRRRPWTRSSTVRRTASGWSPGCRCGVVGSPVRGRAVPPAAARARAAPPPAGARPGRAADGHRRCRRRAARAVHRGDDAPVRSCPATTSASCARSRAGWRACRGRCSSSVTSTCPARCRSGSPGGVSSPAADVPVVRPSGPARPCARARVGRAGVTRRHVCRCAVSDHCALVVDIPVRTWRAAPVSSAEQRRQLIGGRQAFGALDARRSAT